MGRRRRRRSRGGLSRRRFLAGGLLSLGGASLLGGTQAFSQVDATRAASVGSTTDANGLLGIHIPEVVPVGVEDADLIEVTNNTSGQFTAAVELPNLRSGESYGPSQHVLAQDQSGQFTASLSADRATGANTVDIDVTGTGENIGVELSRTALVPGLAYNVIDNTQNGTTQFDIQYDVSNVPSFDSITIQVEDVSASWGPSETFYPGAPSGVVSFPDQSETGGTGGHDFDITFQVYDSNVGAVIEKTITKTADGSNQGEGDFGNENDPVLDWMFVDDRSEESTSDADYTVYYQVSNLENFGEVDAAFQHDGGWGSNTVTTSQRPVGMVEHGNGNAGDGFDIAVDLKNQSGITVDSASRSDTADGDNPENPDYQDIAVSDSPTFDTLDVIDQSSGNGASYSVTYTIANPARFGEVRAQFENLSGSPETNETVTDSSGQFNYSAGYTGGDEYRITIRIFEQRDGVLIPVQAVSYTDIADGVNP